MDFINSTEFPADLARAHLFYKDITMATAVAKCSFEIIDEVAHPVKDQLAVTEADTETAFGTIDGDMALIKEGCDFVVLGPALAYPPGHTVKAMQVNISIGEFSRSVMVYGDRFWISGLSGYRPSEPEPFEQMPLDYSRSYGGTTKVHDEFIGPYPDNPHGCGYVTRKKFVEGTKLPNVEEVDDRITAWKHQPLPAGLAPLPRDSALRGMRGFQVDIEAEKTVMEPAAFLFSHPRMHLPAYPSGERLQIRGMTRNKVWEFTLPHIRLSLEVKLGEAHYMLPLIPDTLCLIPSFNRFFVVARRALVYQFLPKRKRLMKIFWDDEEKLSGSFSTIREQRTATEPCVQIIPENAEVLPLPFDELISYYPLTKIIEELPLLASG